MLLQAKMLHEALVDIAVYEDFCMSWCMKYFWTSCSTYSDTQTCMQVACTWTYTSGAGEALLQLPNA